VWNGDRLVRGTPCGDLVAADSWLVDEGLVRGLDEHRRRFTAACAEEAGITSATVHDFFSAAIAVVPARGRCFPRVEAGAGGGLALRLRTAPPAAGPLRLWLLDGPDPRSRPRVKGPDLEVLGELRRRAQGLGADEAVLLASDGTVLEGALSGLVWWDEDVLCVPDPALPRLASVTSGLLVDLARAAGDRVRHVRARPEDLDGREVWSVSALHGIRPVSGWVATDLRAGPAARAPRYGARLRTAARPPYLAGGVIRAAGVPPRR
jgi:branched-subunit amino acid aminotransferase/4-amino-4-deoxychorismate lyase